MILEVGFRARVGNPSWGQNPPVAEVIGSVGAGGGNSHGLAGKVWA